MPAVPPSRPSVITFQAPASSSSLIHSTQRYGAMFTSASFDPTSERTVKSRANSAMSSSFRSRGISRVPSEISTCAKRSARGFPGRCGMFRNASLKPGIVVLQLLLGGGLHVVVERVAVRVDPDGERAEVLDAELPQALGHELLPGDLLDLLDLGRLERRRAADDGEVDHPVPAHRLDRLVREAALAADRADAVALAERLGEADHPRRGGGADGDPFVTAVVALLHAGRRVQEERAAQVHRRLLALVEDPDLRPVADPDDVALDDDLVAGAELQDLAGIRDREGDLVRRH